jgi:large subunit ribosomal protein L4
MPAKKVTIEKKEVVKKVAVKKSSDLSVPVYSLAGVAAGSLELPKEFFGKKVNKRLLSQAVRIYLTNQKTLLASTKTRGEITASKIKIYAQKGTGRARHGAISAPIFVGGGIVFGPKPREVRLNLPKKMRQAALCHALSSKLAEESIAGLSGTEKATGKTKELVSLLNKLLKEKKEKTSLIVTEGKADNILRAVKNIKGADTLPVNLINAYEILRHDFLLLTKEAVSKLSNLKEIKNA